MGINKIADCVDRGGIQCNPVPPFQKDDQTDPVRNSTDWNRQYEGLSSKERGFREKEEVFFRQSQRKDLDDIEARLKSLDDPLTIPDDLMSDIKDYALRYGHQDDPGKRGMSSVSADHGNFSTD